MKFWRRVVFIFLILIIASSVTLGNSNSKPQTRATNGYWPKAEWRSSTPEEQGMDSERLYKMISYLKADQKDIHSLLIIRNGYLITEAYFYPYPKDFKHAINSCTKSITSALMGIAIGENYIKGVDEKVLPYFSDCKINKMDERNEALTLKHLLAMTMGLEWAEDGGADVSWTQMLKSENPIQYVLDQPMRSEPGKNFYYCSGASQLLSGILQKATGKTAFEYGREKLFGPLGIEDIYWASDRNGVNIGGAGLYMTPADMAKFGYLYLKRGKWDDWQLIPEAWIGESTQKQIDTNAGLARYGYGYHWWMNGFGGYSARGAQGQYIFVLPKYEMVVTFTSSLLGGDFYLPELLVDSYIIPAVQKPGKLKPNPNSAKKLADIIKAVGQAPSAQPIPPMPEIAAWIAGKRFKLEDSSSISLVFKDGKECWLNLFSNGTQYDFSVGLDGVFRIADAKDWGSLPAHNWIACKGAWMDEQTFMITFRELGDVGEIQEYYTFDGNQITIKTFSKIADTYI